MGGATIDAFGKTRVEALENLEAKIIGSPYGLEPDTPVHIVEKSEDIEPADIGLAVFNLYSGKEWPEDAKYAAIVHLS